MENPYEVKLKTRQLDFTYNWNRKLDCHSFTTIRIENPKKYQLLDLYDIVLKTKGNGPDIHKGIARLQHISYFYLNNVNAAMTYIDANLNVIDFQKLVLTMYKNKNINFALVRMCFLVFQYLPIKELEKMQLELKMSKK